MSDPVTVYERMAKILSELPPIGKDQKNVQQNFMFRGHDDVLNALNPLLAKHGVFVMPTVLGRETTQRTTAKGSAMFAVSLLVEYAFYGLAGDCVRGSAWGEGTDMGDKATSKAMTMAFKSVLNQAFAISNKETADPDAHTAEHSVSQAAARDVPSPATNAGGTAAPPAPFTPPAGASAEAGDFTFPSGKHKDKKLSEVPPSYLDWYVENGPRQDVKTMIDLYRMTGEQVQVGGGDSDIPFAPTMDGAA